MIRLVFISAQSRRRRRRDLGDRLPAIVTIEVADYRMQPGLGTVLVALTVLVLVAIAVWAIIRRILALPRLLRRRSVLNQKQLGIDALSGSFVALQAGDAARARMLAQEAQARLPGKRRGHLLEARADLALGDLSAAREHYRALITDPQTAVAALSGLYEQARAQGRSQAALTFARRRAVSAGAALGRDALFDDMIARRPGTRPSPLPGTEPAPTVPTDGQAPPPGVLHTAIAVEAEPTIRSRRSNTRSTR